MIARPRPRAVTLGALGTLALAGLAAPAGANNDLSTANRAGTIAPPAIDGSSSSDASAVGVNQGRASYRIPLVAPPGHDGLEPQLAVAYGGSTAMGDVASGWSLSGIPRIRVRTTGRGGQPVYGTSVTYLGFGGEDLIELGTLPDVDGDGLVETVYREERDLTFVRYVQRSAGGWRADYPDGRSLTLGVVATDRIARASDATWIAAWLPETLTDRSGNQLVYTWTDAATLSASARSDTARYLTEIRYGCQGCATATTYQRVTLTYTPLAAPSLDLGPGFLVETELVPATLATASVTAGVASPVRTLTLAYDATGPLPRLASATTSTADGINLPAQVFTYTDGNAPAAVSSTLASPPTVLFKSGVQPIDVDLDGRLDVADLSSVAPGAATWYRNTGAGAAAFAAAATIDSLPGRALSATGTASLDDGNRDAALDVFDLATGLLYLHDGVSGWNPTGVSATLPAVAWSTNTLRIDVDRDGHVDLVDTSVSPWVIYLDDGAGTFTTDVVTCTDSTPAFGAALLASSAGVLTGDVNGDGLVDIVYESAAKTQGYVFYGRGRHCWGLLPEDNHDANGDGTTDVYDTLAITSAISGPTRTAVSLADVTGDGLDDLVMFDATAARVNAWKLIPGTGWTDAGMGGPFIQANSTTNGCRVADVDADSVNEVICSNGWKVYDWRAQPVGLLETAANGLGMTTTVTYTTTGIVAQAHAAAGHPWLRHVGFALPVVATTEQADGRGQVLVASYDYRDPAIELDELEDRAEYAGFEYVAVTTTPMIEYAPGSRVVDPAAAGTLARSWYDLGLDDALDWFRHGLVVCQETWPATAVLTSYTCGGAVGALSRVESIYTPETDAGGITTVQLDARDEYALEGLATGVHTHTDLVHDAYGNVTATYAWGRWDGAMDADGDDEQGMLVDYAVDVDSWSLRLPTRTQRGPLTASGGEPVVDPAEITYHRYDGSPAWDVTTVTTGLRTATDRWTYDPVSGATSTDTVETVTYTTTGLPDLVTDAAGSVTDHDYDAGLGLFETKVTVDPTGLALATSYVVDVRTGVITQLTAPDGAVTSATYDLLGRMTALAQPGDTLAAPTLTRSYTQAAPVSSLVEVRRDGTADGLVTTSQLDGAGRLLCTAKEATATKVDVVVQREYAATGTTAISWVPSRETACEVITRSAAGRTALRNRDELVTDALGRPLSTTHRPSGTARSWSYQPGATVESDEDDNDLASPHHGTPTTRAVDGRGRLTSVTELVDDDGDGVAEAHATTYTWTALDQLDSVVDPLGTTVFAAIYDSRGRRVLASDPDRGELTTTWDAADRVVATVDARAARLDYTYDAAGRVATVSEELGGVAGPITRYHYDARAPGYSAAACKYTAGRLAYVEDATGRTVYCYDANGHAARTDKTITALGPTALRLDQTFDTLDRPRTLTHPDGTKLTWSYGKDGRASKLVLKGGSAAGAPTVNVVSAATYNGAGLPVGLTLGNGVDLGASFDSRLRPTRSTVKLGATTLADLTLTLDGVGNVAAMTDAAGTSLSAAFSYDALYRLTSASGDRYGGATASYAYDLRGNLLSKTSNDVGSPTDVGTITYRADRVHAVDTAQGETFAYDDAGNLVDDGTHSFTYDAHGMLQSASGAAGLLVTNVYDHAQRRVVKDSAAGADVYYFPEAGLEIRGGVAVKYVAFAGHTVLRFTGTFANAAAWTAQARFLATDHLGGPSLVLDTAGAVVERWASHPYGEDNDAPFVASGHAADFRAYDDPTTVLQHRFQGREIDAETGDYDFGARIYRPDLGRFMSPDSVVPEPGSSQAWNRYAFAHDNPIAFVDPTGHAGVAATKDSKDTELIVTDLLNDVGNEIPPLYNIDGLSPLVQFAMNYQDDHRLPGVSNFEIGEGTRINIETNVAIAGNIDAVLQAGAAMSSKEVVDGYLFMYSYNDAAGNMVTKTLLLDSGRRYHENVSSASGGFGAKAEFEGFGGFGASMTGERKVILSGFYKDENSWYSSRFVTQVRTEHGVGWTLKTYRPDPVAPATGEPFKSKADGFLFDPEPVWSGYCPLSCHQPHNTGSAAGAPPPILPFGL